MTAATLVRERTPDRPGPGPIPDALLRALDLRIGRRVDGLLAGEHRTAAIGLGTELAQIREWEPGDDVRRIDWNATARTHEVQVRLDVAERALTSWVVLDVSPSMRFGTADRRKWDVAEGRCRRARAPGVAARKPDRHRDLRRERRRSRCRRARVVSGFSASCSQFAASRSPSASGRRRSVQRSTMLARMARQRSLAVIVSDFRGPRDWRGPLLRLASRHAVVAVEIRDPREQELPNVGHVWLVDPETGRRRTSTPPASAFASASVRRRPPSGTTLARELARLAVPHLVLSTAGEWLRPFAAFLARERRRR